MKDIAQSLRRLWPFVIAYKRSLIFVFLFSIVISLCNAALPMLGKLLLYAFEKRTPELEWQGYAISAWMLPFFFPALYLVWGTARYFHYFILIMINERIIADIRKKVVDRALHLNLSFHANFDSGSGGLMSRILNDTQVLQVGLNFFGDVLREPLIAISLLATMLYLDWQLTLGLLAFLPFFAYVTKQVGRSLRKYGHANRQAMEAVTADIKENLDGVRVIQSFNLQEAMSLRLRKSMDYFIETRRKIIGREEAVSPINEFLASLLVMGLLLYVMRQVFDLKSSGSDFIAFLIAAGQIQNPIKRLQESFVRVQQTVVVTDRLFSLIESDDRVPQSAHPRPFPMDWKTIEFRNVSFRYQTAPALEKFSTTPAPAHVLRGINLKVNRGEVVALVGSSGSGKSTLVNLLERFYDPTEGDILVDGISLKEFDLKDLRSKIALVTQDVFLFRDTIAANIRSGRGEIDERGGDSLKVEAAAKHAHAHPFIDKTGLRYETLVGERGGLLSGGEKQRVSIARAFFKDAPVLILDEATSALDSVSEQEVQKGLQELMRGRTVFVIAHRLSTVRSAHRILVMKQGEIIEVGTHDELIKHGGEYARFHQIQMHE